MKVISAAALRDQLGHYLDEVTLRGERTVVVHNEHEGNGRGAVSVPLASIRGGDNLEAAGGLDATTYLLSDPVTAARLMESITQVRAGRTVAYDRAALGIVSEAADSGMSREGWA